MIEGFRSNLQILRHIRGENIPDLTRHHHISSKLRPSLFMPVSLYHVQVSYVPNLFTK